MLYFKKVQKINFGFYSMYKLLKLILKRQLYLINSNKFRGQPFF